MILMRRYNKAGSIGNFINIRDTHSLYSSPNIVRVIKSRILRWAGHVARMKEGRSDFKILTGKRPSAWPRRRLEDNIRMNLKVDIIDVE